MENKKEKPFSENQTLMSKRWWQTLANTKK
jgi:hypothetical protein